MAQASVRQVQIDVVQKVKQLCSEGQFSEAIELAKTLEDKQRSTGLIMACKFKEKQARSAA